jgi:N-methylhydantoinase A
MAGLERKQAKGGAADSIAAIDVGGTFTDAVVLRGRELRTCKVPSTPEEPARAVAEALRRLGGADLLIHGTTVATNALLEGKLGRAALVTTAGFRDVLAIGRQNRAPEDLYALEPKQRNPLIPRELRFEAAERVGPGGAVDLPLTEAVIRRVVGEVRAANVEAVAICLLHSYANDVHEIALGRAFANAGIPAVLSSSIAPEFREYERSLVTAANAGLLPLLNTYIGSLSRRVAPCRVVLMHSAGGWLPAEIAAFEPVKLALSGPAGGIAGVRAALDAEGMEAGVAFDVGGTSTDVSLVWPEADAGAAARGLRPITEIAGLPLRTPSLDIYTIGAGGGSIAWLDAGGALQVGPQSAGAVPGPACYGRGGKLPTLTDALLVLGRIPRELKLAGELPLDYGLAEAAIAGLGIGAPKQAAQAVLRVALAGIERALRRVTVECHGIRGVPLVPFGGAGGLLVCDLAELLDTDTALVPREPGLLCALGMLRTPASRDLSRTLMIGQDAPRAFEAAAAAASQLKGRAAGELRDCGLKGPFRTAASVDARYVGQSFELNVPLTRGWKRGFEQEHERQFHFQLTGRPAEIVNVRVRVEARLKAPALPLNLPDKATPRAVGQSGGVPVYERNVLPAGTRMSGPAVVTELSSCLYVKKGWHLKITQSWQMKLRRQ